MRILAVGARYGGVADIFRRAVGEMRLAGETVEEMRIPLSPRPGWAGITAAIRFRRSLLAAEIVHVEFGSNDTDVFWFALVASLLRDDVVVVAHDYPKLVNHPGAALGARKGRLGRALAFRVLTLLVDGPATGMLIRRAGVLAAFGPDAEQGWHDRGARRVGRVSLGSDVAAEDAVSPPSEGDYALYAGFMGPSKGVDVLLRAWGQIEQAVELQLVLAGPLGGPWFHETIAPLVAAVTRPPEILGEIADEQRFHSLIAGAAIVILPYRSSSPASGVLVRALSAGRPVIVTPMPAMLMVEDGVNGLVVPADDPRALAAAIARLCHRPGERDRLGQAALTTARERFSWEGHVADLRAMYESVQDET